MSTKEEVFDYIMNTPGNTNPAVLKSVLNGLPEGASLPEVDESDNGKFLGVTEGAWDKVDAPNGAVVVYATMGSGGVWTISHTYDEVLQAYNSGKTIILSTRSDYDGVAKGKFTVFANLDNYNAFIGYSISQVVGSNNNILGFKVVKITFLPSGFIMVAEWNFSKN